MVNKVSEIYNSVILLYKTELMPIAEKLEKTRKLLLMCIKIFLGIFLLFFLFAMLGFVVQLGLFPNIWLKNVIIFVFILYCVSIVLVVRGMKPSKFLPFKLFALVVKSKLFTQIYKSLDNNLKYVPCGLTSSWNSSESGLLLSYFGVMRDKSLPFKQQVEKLKLYPKYDFIRIDDVITGTYQGHEVQIIEFNLIEESKSHISLGDGSNTESVDVFHGVLFHTTMEKKVKANVFFKQKGSNLVCPSVLKRIKLESNEFEKIFETYSHDEIEARYFLTTAMMEKLIEANNSGQKISGYVCGNSVNIIIHVTKDMFEPDIDKPLNDPNNYFEIIFQAKSMLDMITQLNLESQTGL